jgi:hypothetical protein
VTVDTLSISCLDRDTGFESDVGGRLVFLKEPPARRFEQPVDLDAGRGFFLGHCHF